MGNEYQEAKQHDLWDEADSMSFSMSKDTVDEETGRPDRDYRDDTISNETIDRGNLLLDTYKVISDPIKGGMGNVWKVHHNGWDTDLAMKRPQPRFFAESSEKRKENFIHECEAWIDLGLHPNIVSCYYVREIGGVPTIFSEWMENGSLGDHIRDGSLYDGSEQEVQKRLLDIAIQFARGLHYAHENNLIHQDVKPDNLLLTGTWDAKVADFGVARARAQLADSKIENHTDNTGTTVIAPTGGYTLAYCSMEQLDGKPLTRRTDIYSWALSVLEMYTGTRPWENGTMAGQNCRRYVDSSKVPMPKPLQTLLMKCLAAEPENRPHDFAEIDIALVDIFEAVTGTEYHRIKFTGIADDYGSLNNRALSYIDLGDEEKALFLFDKSLKKENGINNAARWNRRYLYSKHGKYEPEWGHDMLTAETALLEMERGNIFGYYSLCRENYETTDPLAEEYKRAADFAVSNGYVHEYRANAGYICDGKLLLAYDAALAGTESVKLELVDADDGHLLVQFEEAPEYEFKLYSLYRFDRQSHHKFTEVGCVCLSGNGKYAFALNAALFLAKYSDEDYYDHHCMAPWKYPHGIHIWEADTGRYLKYLEIDSITDQKYISDTTKIDCTFDGRVVIIDNWALDWQSGTLLSEDEVTTLRRTSWALNNGIKIGLSEDSEKPFYVNDGKKSEFYDYSKYNSRISVDSKYNRILTYDTGKCKYLDIPVSLVGMAASRFDIPLVRPDRVIMWTPRPFEYKAAYVLSKIREAENTLEQYRILQKNLEDIRIFLEAGKVTEAIECLQTARQFSGMGYDDEIREASWLFADKAIPSGVYRVSEGREKNGNCTQYRALQHYPFKEYEWIYTFPESGNKLMLSCRTPGWYGKYIMKLVKDEKIIWEYKLDIKGIVTACTSDSELLVIMKKENSWRTSVAVKNYKTFYLRISRLDKRPIRIRLYPRWRPGIENSESYEFYRVSFSNGKEERIGKAIEESVGVLSFYHKYRYGNDTQRHICDPLIANTLLFRSYSQSFHSRSPYTAVSDDGRLWMHGSDVYYPEFRWEPGNGMIPPVVSVYDGYEWKREQLKTQGITLYDDSANLKVVRCRRKHIVKEIKK